MPGDSESWKKESAMATVRSMVALDFGYAYGTAQWDMPFE